MAESTLTLTLGDLRTDVAHYLGYNTTFASNNASQQADITRAIKAGIRKFVVPVFSGGRSHSWSFLSPTATLALTASDSQYDLPDNFGSMEGEFSYATTDNRSGRIQMVGEGMIRKLYEGTSSTSGPPQFAAIRVLSTAVTTESSRYEVIFFPTPDASYTLSYKYYVQIDMVSDTANYPVGGMESAECLRAACMAAAEEQKNDGSSDWTQRFTALLEACLFRDKQKERDYFGYMGDRSDSMGYPRDPNDNMPVVATYNGVEY